MKLKSYPEYKDSGVEWIGEIPLHWEIRRLRSVSLSIKNGTSERQLEEGESEFPVTRIESISNGEINFQKLGYVNFFNDIDKYRLEKGDISLSHINSLEIVGNCAMYQSDKPLYSGMNLLRIRPNHTIVPKWLLYNLRSTAVNQKLKSISKPAINQVSIPVNSIKDLEIIFPPLEEQFLISEYIYKKTSEIDLTIEKDTRLIELLKEKRTALINHVVTKGLDPTVKMKDSGVEWIGEIPEDWEIKKLKLISTIVLGKMLTPSDKGGYHLKPYLRAQNISWENVNTDEIREMWFSKNELNTFRLQKDDLLISEGGEVGRTAIWKEELDECYIQNSVHKVTLNHGNNPRYFLHAFETCGKSDFFSSIVNRVSIAHLTREKLKEIKFPVPQKIEQDQIVSYLDLKTENMDKIMLKIQEKIRLLEEYKKSLIHHVVTGKVDVREVAV